MSKADDLRAKRDRMRPASDRSTDRTDQPGATERPSNRAGEQESNRAGEQVAEPERSPIFPDRAGRRRPAVRTADVKFSVLLSPREHAELVRWCSEAAITLGRTRVPTTDAVKALVRLLVAEPTLADATLDELDQLERERGRG